MTKIKFTKVQIKMAKGVKGVPFVVTHHTLLKNMGRIVSKNFFIKWELGN